MKNDLNAADLKKMFLFTAQKIVDSEPYLTEIDSVIGDGDHGTGMALGFSYVIKELPQKKCESAEDVVSSVGLILIDTMGGASGVLFGTMFISGIVDREKHETLDLCGFAEIFRKSLDALKKRGSAQAPGQSEGRRQNDDRRVRTRRLRIGRSGGKTMEPRRRFRACGAKSGSGCRIHENRSSEIRPRKILRRQIDRLTGSGRCVRSDNFSSDERVDTKLCSVNRLSQLP